MVAFKRGGSGSEQQQCVVAAYSVSCDISCVIFRVFIGFIGVLLLLVDYYHSEIFERSENRRARAYYDRGAAVFDSFIGVKPFTL